MNKEGFEQILLGWVEFFEMKRRNKGILAPWTYFAKSMISLKRGGS